jgi:hypothetical protein
MRFAMNSPENVSLGSWTSAPLPLRLRAGLIGGSVLRPGEVGQANDDIRFLDELPSFTPEALVVLRQPLEDGRLTTSRASASLTFPVGCISVATQRALLLLLPTAARRHEGALNGCAVT